MKTTLFIICFSLLSSETALSSFYPQIEPEPDYNIALTFLESYIDFLNHGDIEMETHDWINKQSTVSENFKKAYTSYVDASEFLEFDPILNAQDYPEAFEIHRKDGEYVIVKAKDWPEFKLTLKLARQGKTWLIDGCGVINIPEHKRSKS